MEENKRFFISSFLNKIFRSCLCIWIFGALICAAADFDDQKKEEDHLVKTCKFDCPPIAQDHKGVYDRFLNGKLIYRPYPNSDKGKVELRIADLEYPLNGTFDLSRCGDMGKYLSISTGYRKGKQSENKDKIEIWIAPRFLIEKELNTTASHLKPRMNYLGDEDEIYISWASSGSLDTASDDHTWKTMDEIPDYNLYITFIYEVLDTDWETAEREDFENHGYESHKALRMKHFKFHF